MHAKHSFLPGYFTHTENQESSSKGGNQSGIKLYNQNLIISLIRQHQELTKADITRHTNLSSQTISVNINLMLEEKILLKQKTRRGSIGQPSVPVKLNPEYCYSIGIKIGRNSLNVLLMRFDGSIKEEHVYNYDYPDRNDILQQLDNMLSKHLDNSKIAKKIRGMAIAIPDDLDGWWNVLEIPKQPDMWNNFDLKGYLADKYSLSIKVINDASAACLAEFLLHNDKKHNSFLYIYLGTFIGGGLVLNGNLYLGKKGKAGALGSLPIMGTNEQLLHKASLNNMRQQLAQENISVTELFSENKNPQLDNIFQQWSEKAAPYIAHTIANASAMLDINRAIIDGDINAHYKSIIIEEIKKEMKNLNTEGITTPKLKQGIHGVHSPTMGAAIVPLYQTFIPDAGVVQKLK